VLLLPHELAADVVHLQRGESDAMPPHKVRRGDAVEQGPPLVLDGRPAGILPYMAPKLRTIRTAPRNASVTRSEVASVMKAIAQEREAARGSRQRKRSAAKRAPKSQQSGNA
jgi:hypothetical protein